MSGDEALIVLFLRLESESGSMTFGMARDHGHALRPAAMLFAWHCHDL
ncbi:hypothetical protein [Paenibacillus sp. GCM10023250]